MPRVSQNSRIGATECPAAICLSSAEMAVLRPCLMTMLSVMTKEDILLFMHRSQQYLSITKVSPPVRLTHAQ